jgi:hypothetical protein
MNRPVLIRVEICQGSYNIQRLQQCISYFCNSNLIYKNQLKSVTSRIIYK